MNKCKILVIDDDPAIHVIISRRVRSQGYEVLSAFDGAEGWRMVQDLRPDLILCDWMMPGLSGIEICRRVKQDPDLAGTFIILLTAKGQSDDRVEGLNAGADEFLTKPVEPAELDARIKAGLRIVAYQRDLERLSLVDPLTELRNRRAFDEDLTRELDRSTRYGRPLSLVIADVNDFKKFNDEQGHDKGDEILRCVAEVLSQSFRRSDVTYRIGGDEFAIILPDTDVSQFSVHDRIASRVRQHEGMSRFGATLSVGCAVSKPPQQLSFQQIIQEADRAMYADKERHRKRDSHPSLSVPTPLAAAPTANGPR